MTPVPERVELLMVLQGVVGSGSSSGNSPILKVTLLGSFRAREPSSSSTSAEIANLGRRPEHLLKLVLSVSDE